MFHGILDHVLRQVKTNAAVKQTYFIQKETASRGQDRDRDRDRDRYCARKHGKKSYLKMLHTYGQL